MESDYILEEPDSYEPTIIVRRDTPLKFKDVKVGEHFLRGGYWYLKVYHISRHYNLDTPSDKWNAVSEKGDLELFKDDTEVNDNDRRFEDVEPGHLFEYDGIIHLKIDDKTARPLDDLVPFDYGDIVKVINT